MASIAKRPPLYQEASTQLLQRIARKEWQSGTPLPNELELSAEMGVSVGTVRRALDKLEADRLVIRLQGRGTFVSEQACEEFAARFNNVRDANCKPLSVAGSVLQQVKQQPTEPEILQLKLRPGDRVVRTQRLLSNGARIFMHEQATLSLKHFGELETEAIGDYSLSLLAFRHGVALGCAHEGVTLCRAPDEIASLMGLEPGTQQLRLERTVLTLANEPVEWRVAHCHLVNEVYATWSR